jgi:hypothetical protein
MCVVAPDVSVLKQDVYTAYEGWCADENEEPKMPKAFTTTLKGRGAVKGFGEGKSNGKRVWKGLALREDGGSENPPEKNRVSLHPSDRDESGPPTESDPAQNSCKHGVVKTHRVTFSLIPKTFLEIPLV